MYRTFPQPPPDLYRDHPHPFDERYHRENYGRDTLCPRPRKETDQGWTFQFVIPQFVAWVYSSAAEKFAKKILGESEVEAVLIRLERLTREEARMTGAQILEVVHSLMNNVKVAMGGTRP